MTSLELRIYNILKVRGKNMSGYAGFSMSNNAVMAYNNGEMPLSKWTKTEILEAVQIAVDEGEVSIKFDLALLKKVKVVDLKHCLLYKSSWHHTSSHYNKTDFYSLDIDRLEELTEEDVLKMSEKKTEKKAEPQAELWKCTFLEWSGSRRHPKAIEVTEVGEVKGDWFYRKDGSKKKTTANGFRFIEKVEA